MRDDILGIWGSEAATGKSSGGDIRRRKKSLPFVLAATSLSGDARDRLVELYASPTELDASQEAEVRAILEGCGADALCQRQAELHADRALAALDAAGGAGAGANPFVTTLRALTHSLTARSS